MEFDRQLFLRWVLAAAHILAFGIGFSAILARSRGLRAKTLDSTALKVVFQADSRWALAAALWLVTGVPRAMGAFEKGSSYYFHNYLFLIKMGLFVLVVGLEMWPMFALMKWRRVLARSMTIDTSRAPALARISSIQAFILILMVMLATAMARGIDIPR